MSMLDPDGRRRLATVALLVRQYEEAIAWYTDKLGFRTAEDVTLGDGKRWIVLTPGTGGARLLLAQAADAAQSQAVGNQAGGRVLFFLETDDFKRDHSAMILSGVRFLEAPRHETYGTVAVFEDLYGNRWDLIEPNH